MNTNNNKSNTTIERTQHGIYLCVHINNKRVMKANVSNLSTKTTNYMATQIARAIFKTLEIK